MYNHVQLCDDAFLILSKKIFLKGLFGWRKSNVLNVWRKRLILQFITNIQNQHIWRCMVATGQEGEEKLWTVTEAARQM